MNFLFKVKTIISTDDRIVIYKTLKLLSLGTLIIKIYGIYKTAVGYCLSVPVVTLQYLISLNKVLLKPNCGEGSAVAR